MKKPIEFLREAEEEYLAAISWYRERSLAAAASFEIEFSRVIGNVQESPTRWAGYSQDLRRCFLHRFPFAVVYQDLPDIILVVAIAHCRRRPGYWRDRL